MTIGKQLRQAREAQSISLDQAAQATHIRPHYLEALESNQFDELPSTAQLRGFLRAYGDYLKLDSSELVSHLDTNRQVDIISSVPAPVEADIARELTSSEAIFKEIGKKLRSQRELMGLSLGDVERHTHIRMHYVCALEEGDIAHLPSPVQGRGMLSNYAAFLGLNTEAVLLRFADGLQASLYNRQAARNQGQAKSPPAEPGRIPARPSQLRRLFSMDLFVSGFLVIFLLGFAIWGALRISDLRSGQGASPTAPSVSEILLSTPPDMVGTTLTLEASVEPPDASPPVVGVPPVEETSDVDQTGTPAVVAPTPGGEDAPLQVYVVAHQRTWMRVSVDGEVVFEGRTMLGSAYSFAGSERIVLLTGDGAGLQVIYNQQDLGLLGSFGEVVERVFSFAGVQTATPAVPPTRTPAPTGTVTPTPTATPAGPSATPSPTPRS
jgi:cytoskeleton protein RodZ